jgi:hypothetical protein
MDIFILRVNNMTKNSILEEILKKQREYVKALNIEKITKRK